jgi:hypothetical protein
MALSKVVVEDKIEILELGEIQVRTKTSVLEDNVELSSAYHRHVIDTQTKDADGNWQDTDVSGESARVRALATATWTDAVKTAYQEYIDAL